MITCVFLIKWLVKSFLLFNRTRWIQEIWDHFLKYIMESPIPHNLNSSWSKFHNYISRLYVKCITALQINELEKNWAKCNTKKTAQISLKFVAINRKKFIDKIHFNETSYWDNSWTTKFILGFEKYKKVLYDKSCSNIALEHYLIPPNYFLEYTIWHLQKVCKISHRNSTTHNWTKSVMKLHFEQLTQGVQKKCLFYSIIVLQILCLLL